MIGSQYIEKMPILNNKGIPKGCNSFGQVKG